ncbi:MAG TPA: hypothetical protein PKX23_14575 [Verrucomicrobiota bacterium]|nr:hypothetical protein [Verrucomicrobiota bacterium]
MKPRRLILQGISAVALGGVALAPILFFAERLTLPQAQAWLLAGTFAWFASAPFWMEHKTGA